MAKKCSTGKVTTIADEEEAVEASQEMGRQWRARVMSKICSLLSIRDRRSNRYNDHYQQDAALEQHRNDREEHPPDPASSGRARPPHDTAANQQSNDRDNKKQGDHQNRMRGRGMQLICKNDEDKIKGGTNECAKPHYEGGELFAISLWKNQSLILRKKLKSVNDARR